MTPATGRGTEEVGAPAGDVEYVAAGGLKCPFCRSEAVESVDLAASGPVVEGEDRCLACGRAWTTIYRVAGYVVSD